MAEPGGAEVKATIKRPIKAIVRIRPAHADGNEEEYIEAEPHRGHRFVVGEKDYSNQFATILGPASTQHDAFRMIGLPIVEATLKGQRTCLFAYGQSGAGKTFSMYGAEGGKIPSKLDGIVPSVCAEIFRRKQDVEKRGDFFLELSTTLVEARAPSPSHLPRGPISLPLPLASTATPHARPTRLGPRGGSSHAVGPSPA